MYYSYFSWDFGNENVSIGQTEVNGNDDEGIKAKINLAGIKKDDVKISVSKNKLYVKSADGEKTYTSFLVPRYFDISRISASMSDGLLEISIPNIVEEQTEVSIS